MAGFQGTSTRKSGHEALVAAIEAERREIVTTYDATIVSYDRATQTATIQPKLSRKFGDKTLTPPPIEKVRISMPAGGGFGAHYDMKPGDPVVGHARMRNTDTSQGDGSDADGAPGRMHDFSDSIAFPGGGADTVKMENMPAGGAHYGATDGKKGMQVRADGSTAIVGGPSGGDKFTVNAAGKIDMKSESGDSLLDIVRAALVLIKGHLNSGAPTDAGTQAAADALIAKIDGMKA